MKSTNIVSAFLKISLPIFLLLTQYGCLKIRPFEDQNIPYSKIQSYIYSGQLERSCSFLFFFKPKYEYQLLNQEKKTIAYLDISDLVTGKSLVDYIGKPITVMGSSSSHKHRGVVVIKVKNIPPETEIKQMSTQHDSKNHHYSNSIPQKSKVSNP